MTPTEIVKLLEAIGSHRKQKHFENGGYPKVMSAPKGGYFMRFIFYPVIFHPEEVGYSVTVPDIEGCFTQGNDMNEAVAMAQDAIGLMLEDCKVYPKPSNPADLHTEPGEFIAIVPFDEAAYKKKQKPVKKR